MEQFQNVLQNVEFNPIKCEFSEDHIDEELNLICCDPRCKEKQFQPLCVVCVEDNIHEQQNHKTLPLKRNIRHLINQFNSQHKIKQDENQDNLFQKTDIDSIINNIEQSCDNENPLIEQSGQQNQIQYKITTDSKEAYTNQLNDIIEHTSQLNKNYEQQDNPKFKQQQQKQQDMINNLLKMEKEYRIFSDKCITIADNIKQFVKQSQQDPNEFYQSLETCLQQLVSSKTSEDLKNYLKQITQYVEIQKNQEQTKKNQNYIEENNQQMQQSIFYMYGDKSQNSNQQTNDNQSNKKVKQVLGIKDFQKDSLKQIQTYFKRTQQVFNKVEQNIENALKVCKIDNNITLQENYEFSNQMIHPNIKIKSNPSNSDLFNSQYTIVKRQSQNHSCQMNLAYINPGITQPEFNFSFKCTAVQGTWFAVGIADKTNYDLHKGNFWTAKDNEFHGAYLVGNDKQVFSSHNSQQNKARISFKYGSGDTINIQYDEANKQLKFQKNQNEVFLMEFQKQPDQIFYPCAVLCCDGDICEFQLPDIL